MRLILARPGPGLPGTGVPARCILLGGVRGMDPQLFDRTREDLVHRAGTKLRRTRGFHCDEVLRGRPAGSAGRTLTRRFGRDAADRLEQVLAAD